MRVAEETKTVLDLLAKFGAMTIDQIMALFENSTFEPKPMIAFLCKYRLIQFLDDNYVVLDSNPSYDPEKIYSLWVLLDKVDVANPACSEEIKSAQPCDNGADICFINSKKRIEYLAYITQNNIARVSLLQDTFYSSTGIQRGNEEASKRLYTFITHDEAVMDMIANMDLTIPFNVAYMEGGLSEVPNIEYYQL